MAGCVPHPSLRPWGVGWQGGGSMGRGAHAHFSPVPRLPTPSPSPASHPSAHYPKEPSPAAHGDIGHIGVQRRQVAGFRLRLRRAGRGQGFRCARTTPRHMLPPPCVVSVSWWGCHAVTHPAMPSCVYKCYCI